MKTRYFHLALALVLGLPALAACTSAVSSTLPPATRLEPTATTTGQVYDVPLPPTALATATGPVPAAAPQPTSSQAAAPAGTGGRLTILHTNDSRGYVDPCG